MVSIQEKVSAMSKKGNISNVEAVERRKHWRDRREESDRRKVVRLNLNSVECRSEQPRRTSDIGGELADGEVWWNKAVTPYE